MKKAAFHNLGCKVNSYEMEVMQQKMEENGYEIVPFDDVADVYIVNTCTVTNIADRKSRQMLHKAKQQNPRAVVVAVGCYVQTGLKDLEEDLSVDLCIGNNRKADLAKIVENYLVEREKNKSGTDPEMEDLIRERQTGFTAGNKNKTLGGTTVVDISLTNEYESMKLYDTSEHTRAYIKIQDGCNQFCSYCAIPLARGRVRSRREDEILDEIKGLVDRGYREIVLTGIHISSYGIDLASENPVYKGQSFLVDLMEKIDTIDGLNRIRLSSMEPRIITEETAKRMAALKKLCPHFHLSLQSGCDETLKRMNRHYTTEEYFESVELLREFFEHPAITTDVIVGFPGESEEEFKNSCDFIKKVNFYETHVFKYSKRNGTNAAKMPDQIPEKTKNLRSGILIGMSRENAAKFRSFYLNKPVEVLFEEEKHLDGKDFWIGHTRNYVKVAIEDNGTGESLRNQQKTVMIGGNLSEELLYGVVEGI